MKGPFLFLALLHAVDLGSTQTLKTVTNPTTSECVDISFLVSGKAQHKVLLNPPNDLYSNLTAIGEFFSQQNGEQTVGGNYSLSGSYCTPDKQHPKFNAPLLFMVHGNTYDKSYFLGLTLVNPTTGQEAKSYSWTDYANSMGYYTLSVDRLGTGGSDHPDPVKEVQAPLQAELLLDLVKKYLQSNGLFDRVVYVGHSYGSVLGTMIAAQHPDLLETYVLTGIAEPKEGDNPLPGQLAALYTQANEYDPTRFPPSVYADGYMVATDMNARQETYFSNPVTDFDPNVAELDFQRRATISLGEAATQTASLAPSYQGSVFVTTGRFDAVFCGNGTRQGADCVSDVDGENQLQGFLDDYFPNSNRKGLFLQESSGHSALLHYSWMDAIDTVHDWLEKEQ